MDLNPPGGGAAEGARPAPSIRMRLLAGAAVVLLLFLLGAGLAVQRAHADSVRAVHFGRLQSTVYLLLAQAEVESDGRLVMPAEFAEPRLSLPGSGLYASIFNVPRQEAWQSASTLALKPPFLRELAVGQWDQRTVEGADRSWHAMSYSVSWVGRTQLVLSVVEDRAAFEREIAAFNRTLTGWLGGAGTLLLAAQLLLLRWGLAPLRQVAREIHRVEAGEQAAIEGRYPAELTGLTDNLNALIRQERVRQTRYQEALSFLAHSLKTPLAVLRSAMADPAQLPAAVDEQVARMDDIVQHQLGRARAGGAARFVAPLPVAPVVERIHAALVKVYADKGLVIDVDAQPGLVWRIDEGDLFEMLGNLMDNAAKWSRSRVAVQLRGDRKQLRLRVEDDGPGFSDTESILKLHVRLDERVPGHGVGLAVVSDLVRSHQGTLTLGRADLGGGRVEIVLPAA